MIIALMGYMGSGKSTIGIALAKTLDYRFIDLDAYIEVQENKTIGEIFKTKGEIYFRKKETTYLEDCIKKNNNCVIALGGGTPCYSNNNNLLFEQDKVKTVYLKLSITNLANRLFNANNTRPLISHITSKDVLTEFIAKHLFERSDYYKKAEFIIPCDDKTVQEIVKNITLKLA